MPKPNVIECWNENSVFLKLWQFLPSEPQIDMKFGLWKIGIIFYKSGIHLFGRLRSELCKKLKIKHFTHIVTRHWNKSYETKTIEDEKLPSLWVHGYIFHITQSFCRLFILNIDQCFFKFICKALLGNNLVCHHRVLYKCRLVRSLSIHHLLPVRPSKCVTQCWVTHASWGSF